MSGKVYPDVPIQYKLLLSVEDAAALLGFSRDFVYGLIHDIQPETGKPALHSAKIGKFRRIPRKSLDAFVASL